MQSWNGEKPINALMVFMMLKQMRGSTHTHPFWLQSTWYQRACTTVLLVSLASTIGHWVERCSDLLFIAYRFVLDKKNALGDVPDKNFPEIPTLLILVLRFSFVFFCLVPNLSSFCTGSQFMIYSALYTLLYMIFFIQLIILKGILRALASEVIFFIFESELHRLSDCFRMLPDKPLLLSLCDYHHAAILGTILRHEIAYGDSFPAHISMIIRELDFNGRG